MKRLHSTLCLAALLIGACSEPATAPIARFPSGPDLGIADRPFLPVEQQPVVVLPAGTWALYPGGLGQNLQQTFTSHEKQYLGYLELPVGCVAGVLLNVKIRDGFDGPILYEANVSGLPETVDGSFQLIQVYDPSATPKGIKLHKNHVYAFELAAFPSASAVGTTCGIAMGPSGDSYSGGRGYYGEPPTIPYVPLPNGLPTDDEDIPFITLMRG